MKGDEIQHIDMTNIYLTVGVLIVMNLGAVGSGLFFIIKLVWIAAKYDSRIEKMENDINQAFKKIKTILEESE